MNAPQQDVTDFVKESSRPLQSALNSSKGIFVPMVLIAASVLLWVAFQTTQLAREQLNLDAAKLSQEPVVQNSQKLRDSLNVLATQTAHLAQAGNKSA